VCLQETKLQNIDQGIVQHTVGAKFTNNFVALLATQTRGGILLAANEDYFHLTDQHLSANAVTATCTMRVDGTKWQITVVYGPQGDAEKLQFLQELKAVPRVAHRRWLVLGDFNLIYQAADMNNSNLNRRLIRLNGRRYTWSNEQDSPTLTRIDRLLCTSDWELTFPTCFLHSLPSLMSNHTPLLLQGEILHYKNPSFRFKNF
jgi:exonuclease III